MTDPTAPDPAEPDLPERVLVTGGSGFIGTNLVEGLLGLGVSVRNADLVAPQHPGHTGLWDRCDVRSADALARVVDGFEPTAVVHLAARTDLRGSTAEDYDTNTLGVQRLIDVVGARPSIERTLFASSQLVCTPGYRPSDEFDVNPPNEYGRSKVEGERLVRGQLDASTWALLRPTTIWGPWWGDLYSQFFRTVRGGRYVHPRGVRVSKGFGFVGNAVHQIARLLAAPAASVTGRTLYLSDYAPYPVLEWANEISAAFGRGPVREVPLGALRAAARVGDGLRRAGVAEPPLTSYRLGNILTETSFDMEPVRELCGPLPWTRSEGTRLTVRWMREQAGAAT